MLFLSADSNVIDKQRALQFLFMQYMENFGSKLYLAHDCKCQSI